jgi:hypothetical protein
MPGAHLKINGLRLNTGKPAPVEFPFGVAEDLVSWVTADAYPLGGTTQLIRNEVPNGETLSCANNEQLPIVALANGRHAFDVAAQPAQVGVLSGMGSGIGNLAITGVLPTQSEATIATAFATTHTGYSKMIVFSRFHVALDTGSSIAVWPNTPGSGSAILSQGYRLPADPCAVHLLIFSYRKDLNKTITFTARLRRADGITDYVENKEIVPNPNDLETFQWRAGSAGSGPRIASQAAYNRAFTLAEIDTLILPSLKTYYGVA